MSLRQVAGGSDVDERLAALVANANAVRAIASAVEGTIGSKGLDSMLVDRFGEVVITNDGITILTRMDVNHPAAKMVINVARAQEEEVGDGTTTATIMAGALLGEGVNQVIKGVPVTRIIEGIRLGVERAVGLMQTGSIPVKGLNDPILRQVALVAGRGHADIAELVAEAAGLIGDDKLGDPAFKLADTVLAQEGAANEVFLGLVIERERLNRQMPREISDVRLLVVDDDLEPEALGEEALATEIGFNRHLELQEEFKENLQKAIDLGVNLVVIDGNITDIAEEILTDAGVVVLPRVSRRELQRLVEHTGARSIKRTGLKKAPADLKRCLGRADRAYEDEKLEHVRLIGGKGAPMATILVGAATEEVVDERERIARDAASAVQAAVRGGVLPGGGAVELAVSRQVADLRDSVRGMAAYGVDCVVEALRKPLSQIVANAGFNPLEKVGDTLAAQAEAGRNSLAVDCDTGEVVDVVELGVVDPTLVKTHALKAAGEIAEAILRINTIIKKREEGGHGPAQEAPDMDEIGF